MVSKMNHIINFSKILPCITQKCESTSGLLISWCCKQIQSNTPVNYLNLENERRNSLKTSVHIYNFVFLFFLVIIVKTQLKQI